MIGFVYLQHWRLYHPLVTVTKTTMSDSGDDDKPAAVPTEEEKLSLQLLAHIIIATGFERTDCLYKHEGMAFEKYIRSCERNTACHIFLSFNRVEWVRPSCSFPCDRICTEQLGFPHSTRLNDRKIWPAVYRSYIRVIV
jgi:hypothetical protein